MCNEGENSCHVCEGVSCPYVVDTGEAYVCTETGICVGDLFVVCFDYTSSSTRFNVSSTVPASSFIKNVAVANVADKDGKDAKGAREQMYAECFRVVSKLLKDDHHDAVAKRKTKLLDKALQQAAGVTKKHRDGKLRLMPVVFELVRLMQDGAKTGATVVQGQDWQNEIARRCADCCALCFSVHPNVSSAKVKPAYMCLAVLYMLREGVTVKGVKLCAKDESVANRLPSLNTLAHFGYQKSKYTKAERFLGQSIQHALFTRPLHEIRF
jgi:hypothetical protein